MAICQAVLSIKCTPESEKTGSLSSSTLSAYVACTYQCDLCQTPTVPTGNPQRSRPPVSQQAVLARNSTPISAVMHEGWCSIDTLSGGVLL